MSLTFTRAPDSQRYTLRPRGSAPLHVRRGAPDGRALPEGYKPRFVVAADAAGASPLAVVVRKGDRRLAVLSQWRTDPRILLTLPASAFTPRPKVDSSLVEFLPKDAPQPPCDVSTLERVTAAAFGQRRKMLRSALAGLAGSSAAATTALEAAGVDPTARGEVLDVIAFARIAEQLSLRT